VFGTRSEIRFQPRGVVLILAAWNYPFALIFAPLTAAVAAGNCVMMRPSEKVPNTNRVAAKIVAETFEPEEAALVRGDRSTADLLLDLPFDHIFFTGSTPAGRRIMAAAANHLSSVTLELGGKSPAIVDETADIGHAARSIVWGKYVNAGQTCVAPDYAFVHESKAAEFFDAARRALAASYGASDAEKKASRDYCRIIDGFNTDRLTSLLEAGLAAGAKIEAGGQVDAGERYVAPTILSGVRPDSPLMEDEIFGPLLPVMTYRSLDEIYAFLQGRPKPLAMYIFSRRRERIDEIVSRTCAGGTVANNCLIHLLNPNLPFGGVGASGFGSYHGRFGFRAFSHERAFMVQGRPSLSHLFHPPYARLKSGWLGKMLAAVRRLRD
jgi:aldehyde dehydrogenase (NAD+)